LWRTLFTLKVLASFFSPLEIKPTHFQGAHASVYAALSPRVRSGTYLVGTFELTPAGTSPPLAKALLQDSAQVAGLTKSERKAAKIPVVLQ